MYFITYYLLVIVAIFLTLLLVYIVVNSSNLIAASARLYKAIMYFASNILFLPIIRFFLSIFSCSKTTNIHVYATGFVCWKGLHYIHISIGMIFLCFYLAYSFMFQATFFETAMQQSQPIGKFTSNCEVVLLIEKAAYLVFFSFYHKKLIIVLLLFFLLRYHLYLWYITMKNALIIMRFFLEAIYW